MKKSKKSLKEIIIENPQDIFMICSWLYYGIQFVIVSCFFINYFFPIFVVSSVIYFIILFFYERFLNEHGTSFNPTDGDLSSIYRERIDYSLDSSKSECFKDYKEKNNKN